MVLTKELIIDKCKKENFNEIKNVNLWGNDLSDMTMIRQLQNIEVVSLSVNKINTLVDFAYCTKIQELYLRKNLI
jgi:Leucine-rich repeat (LRR) protein